MTLDLQDIEAASRLPGIEHELRNALNIVLAYLMLAERRLQEQEPVDEQIEVALRAAHRCVDALEGLSE